MIAKKVGTPKPRPSYCSKVKTLKRSSGIYIYCVCICQCFKNQHCSIVHIVVDEKFAYTNSLALQRKAKVAIVNELPKPIQTENIKHAIVGETYSVYFLLIL